MTKTKRVITLILCLALCFTVGGELLAALTVTAKAETAIASYDDTDISDDLADIDLSNYPANSLGECDIISFMEYCFTEISYYEKYFGLYVYVYNPTEKDIVKADEYNFVNIATEYDINGVVTKYESVNLEYLSKSSDNRFYKFKISDSFSLLEMAQQYAASHNGIRRYEIIELQISHGSERESVDVSKIYEWNGFGAYCSSDSSPISTLTCIDYGSRSIHLELNQTNYRFAENPDTHISDDLSSVYFSIPEEYFREFGNLDRISAEWYEYKTQPIFVTSDKEAYSALWDMRNVLINEYGQKIDENGNILDSNISTYWRVLWDEYSVAYGDPGFASEDYYFRRSYNPMCRDDLNALYNLSSDYLNLPELGWLFYTDALDYRISKERVLEYLIRYSNFFYSNDMIRGKYSSDLFSVSIDSDRWKYLVDPTKLSGLVKMDFNANSDFDANIGNTFLDSDESQSLWSKLWFGHKLISFTYSPIVVISDADLVLDETSFSEKYYVNTQDVSDVIEYAKQSYKNGERPVLLRFAVTDYYASSARFDYAEEKIDMSEQNGYVAQETMFLDFDILSLGFKSADGYTDVIIGVVSEPIDIINGLSPPDDLVENQDWWFKIMMLLGVIVLLIIISYLPGIFVLFKIIFSSISFLFSIVWGILSLPFKILKALFDG